MAKNRPPVHTFTLAASAHLTTSHGHLASVMPSNPLRILVPESLRPSTPAPSSRFTCRPSTTVSNTTNYSPLCLSRHAHLLCQRNGLGYAHHLVSNGDASVTARISFWGAYVPNHCSRGLWSLVHRRYKWTMPAVSSSIKWHLPDELH